MRYYAAREIQRDGKATGLWHYTVRHDEAIFPVGYCADGCPGHATPEEACDHQKQWDLDHARFHRGSDLPEPDALYRCKVCRAFTAGYATYGPGQMSLVTLCDEHCNRQALAGLIRVGERVSSC